MRVRATCLAVLLMALSTPLTAQETNGAIRGRLVTAETRAITEAIITATSPDLLGERRTVSRGDGVYTLLALPPGSYTLRVAAIGYRPVVIEQITVQLGRMSGLGDLVLEPAAVALAEITITAPQVTLDPVGTTIGATLEAEDLEGLPGARDYKSLMTLLPHVNTSYHGDPPNAMGSTGLENMYFIDGVNVTMPSNAGTSTGLPRNFIKSVEVRAGGYEAEFGRALGAIVNAVTYTGTNTFTYAAFGNLAHHSLSANPRAGPVLKESGQYSWDAGVRIGGPLVRDRLWYSAAINPSLTHSLREIPALGNHTDESRSLVHAANLLWRPGRATTIETASFGDGGHRNAVGLMDFFGTLRPLTPDPYLTRVETGGSTALLRLTHELGSVARLEARVARSTFRHRTIAQGAAGEDATYVDYVAQTIEGGVPWLSANTEQRHSVLLKGAMLVAQHSIVAGVEYEDNRAHASGGNPRLLVERRESGWTTGRQAYDGRVGGLVASAFVQDAWRVSPRLTVTVGVRWSDQRIIGVSGRTAQRFAHEWQPRLGFSHLLRANGSQRVFGSYGRFVQQQPLTLAILYYQPYLGYINSFDTDPRSGSATPMDSVDFSSSEEDYPPIPGAKVESTDEITLGYEQTFAAAHRLTVRGMYRRLGSVFQQGFDGSWFFLGMPGEGDLDFLPPPRRTYAALEAALEGTWRATKYRLSYVLSRSHGNYTGLYSSDQYYGVPGNNAGLATAEHSTNTTGLLPNDRTHVGKVSLTRRLGASWEVGMLVSVESGTPINEFGANATAPWWHAFLAPRGSVGRTPALYDAAFRVRHERPVAGMGRLAVVLDLLHAGNPRGTTRVDMVRYRSVENGVQGTPNPDYLQPTGYQPPMMARLGVEILR